ncbi:MAG TPA: hypothetical protein DCF61_12225 [Alphaproteobacteria bacterium]|nr:hypothetical protein [Alphaproteobacteria bacterium]HAM46186.1 hypothetical protein [Alphaproteobacteria bacterium]HBC53470.1 hypothetical protein [Alphaproteobacteria bacterium]HCO92033.1 hypothetical protein [Alphaproteobacteria bacterium]
MVRIANYQIPLWPTLFAIPAFIVLLSLGSWQVQRLQWKNALTETITAQTALPPVPLPADISDPAVWKYRPVTVEGQFHHDKELHLFGHNKYSAPGYLIITPLERADGSFVFVSRGWVPPEKRPADTRPEGQISGTVQISGLARLPWSQQLFVADNEPEANIWFFGDIDAMAATHNIANYAPVYVEADATGNPGGFPVGGQSRITFRNDHLSYALTWYSLAVILALVYAAFVVSGNRKND